MLITLLSTLITVVEVNCLFNNEFNFVSQVMFYSETGYDRQSTLL